MAIGRALSKLGAELSEACPDLILGFDHDLWGEPNRLDLTCFKMSDFCRVCDIPDRRGLRTPMEARRLFYRRALVFPPESMALGSLRIDGANPVAAVATALAGFPFLAGLTERMSSGQSDWLRGVLGWYRALSRRVNFHERFHFLHGKAQALPGQWDGYAKLNRKGEGFLAVFRNDSPDSTHRFSIPGLDLGATFRLESVLRDRVIGIHSAHELAEGVSFEVRHEDGADLVESRRVDG